MLQSETDIKHFREGFNAGVDSITGMPKVEDHEAFRSLRRRVTPSSVDAWELSDEDEQALLRFLSEARDVAEAVLDRLVAEHINARQ